MRSNRKLVFLILVFVSIHLVCVQAQEVDLEAVVTNIVDGDTFDLDIGERVRFADIDAPEPNDPGGPEAKQFLTSLILGKTVYLDIDDIYRTDYKGDGTRLVCLVFIEHSDTHRKNINEALVQEDHAIHKDYENEFSPPWPLYWRYAPDPPPPDPDPPPIPPPDPPPPPKPRYQLNITIEGQGTIDHPIGTTTYVENSELSVIATPKERWKFEKWILNSQANGSQTKLNFTMIQDIHLIVLKECLI